MKRPPWEVADVIRKAGNQIYRTLSRSLTWAQLKVLTAIARCRTAALGGHRDQCARCGIRPSPITPAATATVRSARPTRARSG